MFQGFSRATVDFMWGIRFNNDRAWFEAHKGEYLEHLYEPMRAFCAQTFQVLGEQFPQYGLRSKVSRIYRDARRLHGRGPYKDHLWCSLERAHEPGTFAAQPVFWFELAPESWSYGMGYYAARALTMEKHRARMDRDPGPMKELVRRLEGQGEFVLEGPSYAREKPAPDPSLRAWYNKRTFSLIHEESPLSDVIYDPALADRVVEGCRFLMPFYDYFSSLDGDADPRG